MGIHAILNILNGIMHVNYLAQFLEERKHSINEVSYIHLPIYF